MKGRQGSYNGEADEHNMPTEPIALPPITPTVPVRVEPPNWQESPSPLPYANPVPVPPGAPPPVVPPYPFTSVAAAYPPGFHAQPGYGIQSPYIPPASIAPPKKSEPERRIKKRKQSRARSRRFLPGLVNLFFYAVQVVIFLRVALKFLNIPDRELWIKLVYEVSNVFVLPVHTLIQQVGLPFPIGVEISALLAILVYGFFAFLLAGTLKTLLRSS